MAETPIERALRLARAKGMNQTKFAEKMGVLPQHVTNWKKRGMPPEHYRQAAQVVGITIDALLSDAPHEYVVQANRAPPPRVEEPALRWATEQIPDSPGAVAHAARLAVEFLRHHAEALSASDRRMVATLLASYVGNDDAGEQQLEAISGILGNAADKPRQLEYDGSPSGPSGRTFGEGANEESRPRKSTGRRKK